MKRREFIKIAGVAAAALYGVHDNLLLAQNSTPDVVRVTGGEPVSMLQTALNEFGGLKTFISKGDVVVVKPNIGWDRAPELAGNTNPDLIAEIVKQCLALGAKKVKIFDRTCNNPQRCYATSLIEEKAVEAGAEVTHVEDNLFKMVPLKNGRILKEWPTYQEYLEANKIINVPIAKHHRIAGVTLGMKNLMRVMGGTRGDIHTPFSTKLLDIVSEILPTLTIIDAYRILTANGPSGGSPDDVKLTKTLVVSPCTVSADASILDLFGLTVGQVEHVKEAYERGLAKYDASKLKVKQISLP